MDQIMQELRRHSRDKFMCNELGNSVPQRCL